MNIDEKYADKLQPETFKELVRSMDVGSLWTRPLERPFDWTGICEVQPSALKTVVDSGRYRVVHAQSGEIAIQLLCDITDTIRLLNETTRVYNTPELISSHTTVFRLMRERQHVAVGTLPAPDLSTSK